MTRGVPITVNMPAAEIAIDAELVHLLLGSQFPEWVGWDNGRISHLDDGRAV
jgi:hypothetical protein